MKKNGRLVAIALGSVLCASCVGGAFLVAGSTPAAETVKAADGDTISITIDRDDFITFDVWSYPEPFEIIKDGVTFKGEVKTGSGPTNRYGYLMFASGCFIYNENVPDGYYLSELSGTYSSTTGTSGKAFSNLSSTVIDSNTTSGTSYTPKKSGSFSHKNSDETIKYGNVSATKANVQFASITFAFSKTSVNYDHIAISGEPNRNIYYVGDAFSTEGLSVFAYPTADDTNGVDVTDLAEWSVSPNIFDQSGSETEVAVKATYSGLESAEAIYMVDVREEATVLSLDIEGEDNLLYYVGDTFSLDGLTIYANMSDGEKIDVTNDVMFEKHVFNIEDGKSEIAEVGIEYKGVSDYVLTNVGFMPIAEARGLSKEVTIVGVITGKMRDPNSQYKNSDFYLNDGTAGLRAFRVDDSLSSELKFGDRVIMTGTPQLYNGFYELTDVSYVEVIEEGVEPEPLQIVEFSADALKGKDGMYVSLSGLSYKDGSLWAANKRDTMTFSFAGGDVDAYCVLDSDAQALQDELNGFFDKIEGLKFDYTGNMTFFNSNPQISPISIDEFSCPDYDAVMAFVDDYMHPEVSHDDTDEGNACLEWYPTAKKALEGLTEDQQDYFLTSNETAEYAARYKAWAIAYGEGATSSLGRIMSSNDTAAIIALVALSSATVAAAGFMIASRRRKAK